MSIGDHFVSGECRGEECFPCLMTWGVHRDATHKLGEEIPHDDPVYASGRPLAGRHNLTAYVCCHHFRLVLGAATGCPQVDVCPTCGKHPVACRCFDTVRKVDIR